MLLSNDAKLQEDLRLNEFMTDSDKFYPTEQVKVNIVKLSEPLQKLRSAVGELRITSGWRSSKYNKSIGGDVGSYHISGLAADVEFIKRKDGVAIEDYGDWTINTLLPLAHLIGFSNIGFYIHDGRFSWIHVDIGKPWEDTFGWTKYSDTLSYKIHNV